MKKMLYLLATYLLLSCHSALANTNNSASLSSLQIVSSTIKATSNCLHYKITGLCFWKECFGAACWINTTLKVDHYLPDAVVSVYRQTDSNPWDYANTVVDPAAKQAGQVQVKNVMGFNLGYGNGNSGSPETNDNHFKEADLIGNPAIMLFSRYTRVLLPSQATAFIPYYLSLTDAYAWRSPLVESMLYPFYLVPGVHIVGSLVDNWGSVYPRTGFIDQPADAKAAAVISQRAASIATQGAQPHLYNPLNTTNSCGDHCDTFAAKENDPNTQWQMVYPTEQNSCLIFGANDMASLQPWGQADAVKGDGNYAWVMWRRYKGCIPDPGGSYIGSIGN